MDDMNTNKHIWEGWTVQNFIDSLSAEVELIMTGKSWKEPFKDYAELEKWCADHQPFYKQPIPEVVDYFARRYRIEGFERNDKNRMESETRNQSSGTIRP